MQFKKEYTIDGLHVCFLRMLTSFCFLNAVASANVAGYANESDRRSHVMYRLMVTTVA